MTDVQNNDSQASAGEVKVDTAAVEAAKAEAKKLADELEQAQHTIVELKRVKKEAKTDDKVDMQEAIKQAVQEHLEPVVRATTETTIEDELSKMTNDPKVRDAVLASYEKDIAKSGLTRVAIQADLRKAFAIATAETAKHVAGGAAHAAAAQGAAAASSQPIEGNTLSQEHEANIRQVMQMTGSTYEVAKVAYLKNINR